MWGHVASTEKIRNVRKILGRKPDRKEHVGT
jgi:hypothetical protein